MDEKENINFDLSFSKSGRDQDQKLGYIPYKAVTCKPSMSMETNTNTWNFSWLIDIWDYCREIRQRLD